MISAVKRVEFVRDRMSYIQNMKTPLVSHHCSERSCPTEYKVVNVKGSFYEVFDSVFDKFPPI
jgi:hypothetical protein